MKVIKKNGGWQLVEDYTVLVHLPTQAFKTTYFSYDGETITGYKGYFFDGASGPVRDTNKTMVPAFAHDVTYQAIREGKMPLRVKKLADLKFVAMCRTRGRGKFLSWVYLRGLALFGGRSCVPGNTPEVIVFN